MAGAYSTIQSSTGQYRAVQKAIQRAVQRAVQCGTVWYSVVQFGTVLYSLVQFGTVRGGTVRYTVEYQIEQPYDGEYVQ